MPTYTPPLRDMQFVMHEVLKVSDEFKAMPPYAEVDVDTINAVIEEAGKFAAEVTFPLNISGDTEGCVLDKTTHEVKAPSGFKEAYAQYVEGGWPALSCDPEFGGQGLPFVVNQCFYEMLNSANQAWTMYPGLSHGAYECLHAHGSAEQKATFLPKLTSGEWTGTMCLTEPHCGTDLGLLRTKAEPQADGSYRLTGQKIFISAGEHDLAENIVHLVLARLPDAPAGSKGISLFLVPKVLPDGTRNDVHCVSIEHKLGIKASPTAVLQYGDHGGAVGQLIGQENQGLAYMFVMMNAARYAVGMQGVALAERAYQKAVAYARERVQGKAVDGSTPAGGGIIHHPDVKRMLMTMRAFTEGSRAMAAVAAAAYDAAHAHPDEATRQQNQAFSEFLVPLVKGFSTEMSLEVTSLAVQVHGGMGFIEETGVAQMYRDAKILTIYEGTTAIQANDLVGRKTARDGGAVARGIAAQIEATEADLARRDSVPARAMLKRLRAAREAFLAVVDYIVAQGRSNPGAVYAGSVPYLMLAGNLVAGWQMARALLIAEDRLAAGEDVAFMQAKIATARFYADHVLSRAPGVRDSIVEGAVGVTEMALEAF